MSTESSLAEESEKNADQSDTSPNHQLTQAECPTATPSAEQSPMWLVYHPVSLAMIAKPVGEYAASFVPQRIQMSVQAGVEQTIKSYLPEVIDGTVYGCNLVFNNVASKVEIAYETIGDGLGWFGRSIGLMSDNQDPSPPKSDETSTQKEK